MIGHRTRARRTPRATATGAALLAMVLGAGAAPAAATTTGDEGQWWYDLYQVETNHAEGWTGEGVKIAVIDTQINPDLPVFADADLTVGESLCVGREPATTEFNAGSQHGTNTTALLVGNGEGAAGIRGIVPDAEVLFLGYGNEPEGSQNNTCQTPPEAGGISQLGWGLRQAIDAGADIVNMSFGLGPLVGEETSDAEVVAEAVARGIVLVGAVPNPGEFDTAQFFPWGYRGVVAVNAMNRERELPINTTWNIPNKVSGTTVVAAGLDFSILGTGGDWNAVGHTGGTSLATPLVAGMLAATKQKYPEATGNQLLQSLIHNTGADDHELAFDDESGFGYGLASLSHMLRVDPTQYDDVNPLLDKSYSTASTGEPTDEQFAAAAAALEPTEEPSSEPAAGAGDAGDTGGSGAVVAVIAVVAVVLVAGVVVTVVISRKNRTQRARSTQ
ncbi:S8 family peptidase [Microbacterium sp. GXF7504]